MNGAQKKILCIATPIYIGIFLLLAVICAVLAACNVFTNEQMEIIVPIAVIVYLVVGTAVYMIFARLIKIRESAECLKNYDFSPVEITDNEQFCGRISVDYYYRADPFDKNEEVTLYGGKATDEYAAQFAGRIIGFDVNHDDDAPFYINDLSADERNSVYNIRKELCGDELKVSVAQTFSLAFTPDGIVVDKNTFSYDKITAECRAWYMNYEVHAKVIISVPDEIMAVFSVGSRIAATLKKYNIPVENGELLDFIMESPKGAFRKIAGTISTKRAMNYTLKK